MRRSASVNVGRGRAPALEPYSLTVTNLPSQTTRLCHSW